MFRKECGMVGMIEVVEVVEVVEMAATWNNLLSARTRSMLKGVWGVGGKESVGERRGRGEEERGRRVKKSWKFVVDLQVTQQPTRGAVENEEEEQWRSQKRRQAGFAR